MNAPPALPERPAGPLRRRWRPLTVLSLWLAWLLLNQSVAPGHLLLGLVLALALGRTPADAPGRPAEGGGRGARRRPRVAAVLAWIVLHDIVVANLQVAARILGPRDRLRPQFVWVPLAVRRPRSITLLAGIITMTPGTVSAELSDDHTHLLVHALDVEDPAALVADVKSRYEARIRELFE